MDVIIILTNLNLAGCIGAPMPNKVVKLSDGDRGQLFVKAPGMFTQ